MLFVDNRLMLELMSCPCRWLFRRKKLFIILFVIVICLTSILIVALSFFNVYCSFKEVQNAVNKICSRYQNKEAKGSLCVALCETKTLLPSDCIPNHLGKDVVFKAVYNGKPFVVKSSKLNPEDHDQVFWINETGGIHYPSIESFYDMLSDSIKNNLNLHDDHHIVKDFTLVKKLWAENTENLTKLHSATLHVVMHDVWNLVQQPEYLLLKYYDDRNLFPKILGTCSYFYIEEFVQPLNNYFLLLYPAWQKEFTLRAKIALQIIYYIELLESYFPKLHLCDVKMGHFGFDSNGDVKLLDMDMVFQEPNLIQNMVAVKNCSQDEDCSFIDCKGSCEETSQECRPVILNNNFERVCSNIFSGNYLGLLALPPKRIQYNLQLLLQRCSSKAGNVTDITAIKELKLLLETFS